MTWARAVVIPAFIAWVAYRITKMRMPPKVRPLPRELDLPRRRYTLAELLAADPRDPGTWPGVPPLHPVPPLVHQTPPHDAVPQVTPCCSVPLLELPPGSHFSSEPSERTCNRAGGEA